jgi:hypothetical protein
MAANPLLRSFTAIVHGYACLPRGGFTRGFSTDMHGFPTETDFVADEAARAVRTRVRAAAERPPGSQHPMPDAADGRAPGACAAVRGVPAYC